MPNLQDMEIGERIMALFVGPAGCGKSCAAGSWPGPIKFFDFDGRMAPLKRWFPTRSDIFYDTYGPKAIGARGIKSYTDFCEEWEDLQDNCPWATTVIDGLTSLSNTSVTYQLQVRSGSTRLSPKTTKGGLIVPSWDEFNGETSTITQVLDVAKILPCHVIMTAHPVIKTEIRGEGSPAIKSESYVAFGNKLPSFIPIYFNEIWKFRLQPGGEDGGYLRQVITQPFNDEMTPKTSLPLPVLMDITGQKLFKVVQGYLEQYQLKLAEALEALKAKQGHV